MNDKQEKTNVVLNDASKSENKKQNGQPQMRGGSGGSGCGCLFLLALFVLEIVRWFNNGCPHPLLCGVATIIFLILIFIKFLS